jgi:hypothetical protein
MKNFYIPDKKQMYFLEKNGNDVNFMKTKKTHAYVRKFTEKIVLYLLFHCLNAMKYER